MSMTRSIDSADKIQKYPGMSGTSSAVHHWLASVFCNQGLQPLVTGLNATRVIDVDDKVLAGTLQIVDGHRKPPTIVVDLLRLAWPVGVVVAGLRRSAKP